MLKVQFFKLIDQAFIWKIITNSRKESYNKFKDFIFNFLLPFLFHYSVGTKMEKNVKATELGYHKLCLLGMLNTAADPKPC